MRPTTQIRTRARRYAGVTALALALGACVFGFRGEVDFGGEASLFGLDTVQIHTTPTELVLTGDAARTFIDWQGTWITLGGSSNDALAGARRAELRWESWGQLGRLAPRLPVDIRDITSLEHLDVQSASYLAHEVVGTGDVFVSGIDAYVSVNLDGGDVDILGGVEQLQVSTTRGDVTLTTSAAADVYSGLGAVTVRTEVARDIDIETTGPVLVELTDVTNLDIDIEGAGQIVVELDTAAHVGAGEYRRAVGSAANTLKIRPNGGRVTLNMLDGS